MPKALWMLVPIVAMGAAVAFVALQAPKLERACPARPAEALSAVR